MKTLVINTYAGSLLVGARFAKIPVVASFEDTGFGSEIAEANFPKIKHYRDRADWPDLNLSDTLTIAHPPCAAFSVQNYTTGHRKGVEADSFKCHKMVMDYALSRGTPGLAIESVQGALEGARAVHDAYAKKYGYFVFRILQNAVTFGVPQWRPRFWVIFLKDHASLRVWHNPVYRSLDSIMDDSQPADPVVQKGLDRIYARFEKAGFDFKKKVLETDNFGGFLSVISKAFDVKDDSQNKEKLRKRTGTTGLYHTCLPRHLDPTLYASTVLSDSYFFCRQRALNRVEYHRIMGFPDGYRWPGSTEREFRKYLSKGVCPPVAAWVLRTMQANVLDGPFPEPLRQVVENGQTLDLQVPRAVAETGLRQRRMF